MKTFAKYFLFGFCVFFLFGVWQGWQERRNTTDEELQAQTAIFYFGVKSGQESQTHNPTLTYACDSNTYFTYDLSTDEQREYPHPLVESSVFTYEGVERVFEAATGYKLFEIVRAGSANGGKAESSGLLTNKRVALLAGSLSGYFAGRAIAARTRPSCDSPNLLNKLRDKNSPLSIRARREFFRQSITFLYLNVDGDHQRIIDGAPQLRSLLDKGFTQTNTIPTKVEEIRRFIFRTKFRSLEEYWNKFSDTSYNPKGRDCIDLVSASVSFKEFLEIMPDILKEAYPNAKNIAPETFVPIDFRDQTASGTGKKASFLSSNLMLLTVGGCFIVLGILGAGVLMEHFRDKRKADKRTVGFALQPNRKTK